MITRCANPALQQDFADDRTAPSGIALVTRVVNALDMRRGMDGQFLEDDMSTVEGAFHSAIGLLRQPGPEGCSRQRIGAITALRDLYHARGLHQVETMSEAVFNLKCIQTHSCLSANIAVLNATSGEVVTG
jgi:hypothetical protein